ncbi:hypothetical protein PVAP13_3KG128619 [Panicum virgatum]|uniref:Uncharacterized protein n=1 Tax=Panicum virgatum TaxID=38727 RepID=A0A8T0UTL2_PANVG|nr:hypothetical protein PVAP13_3KG128619 [Panicum virgatum]
MTLSKTTKLFARYTVAEENTQEKRALATDAGFASIDPDYRERRDSRTVQCTKCNCAYTITKFQQFLVISGIAQNADRDLWHGQCCNINNSPWATCKKEQFGADARQKVSLQNSLLLSSVIPMSACARCRPVSGQENKTDS